MIIRIFGAKVMIGALLALVHAPQILAQDQKPPELNEMLEEFEQTIERDVVTPQNERISKLDQKYKAAVEQASAAATKKGDLDTVLELKKELKRLADKKPFDLEQEFKTDSGKRLGSAYTTEIQKIRVGGVHLKSAVAQQLINALEILQKDLTIAGKLDDAILVKKFREGDGLKNAISSHETKIVGMPPIPKSKNEEIDEELAAAKRDLESIFGVRREMNTKAEPSKMTTPAVPVAEDSSNHFAAHDPTLPGDRVPCRLVIIPLPNENAVAPAGTHATFEAVKALDKTDIVGVGRTIFPSIGAIQADGSMIYLTENSATPEIIPGNHVFCDQSFLLPLIGLKTDGTLSVTIGADPALEAELKAMNGVVSVTATSGVAGIIKNDGMVYVVGPRNNVPTPVQLKTVQNAAAITFSGAAYANVLTNDGEVIDIVNGTQKSRNVEKISRLFSTGLGLDRSGNPVSWGAIPSDVISAIGRNPLQLFNTSKSLIAIDADGAFHFFRQTTSGEWSDHPAISKALKGCRGFAQIGGSGEVWLLGILPSTSVPRSGVWDVEELGEARTF